MRRTFISTTCLIFSAFAFANTTPPAAHYDYDFKPHQKEEFQSPFPWEVKVSCSLSTQDAETPIQGKLISSKATVNGKKYHQGEEIVLPVHNADKFSITAGSFIKVRLENLGENSVHFHCKV